MVQLPQWMKVLDWTLFILVFQNVGVGKFRPNLLLMGFKCNWTTDTPEHVHQYFSLIQSVHFLVT